MTFQAFSYQRPTGGMCLGEVSLGSPPRVVIVHDVDQDIDAVRALGAEIVRRGFGVILVDLPGHGLSDGPFTPPADGEAAALVTALAPFRLEMFVTLGVGAGAGYALAYGAHANAAGVAMIEPHDCSEHLLETTSRRPKLVVARWTSDMDALGRRVCRHTRGPCLRVKLPARAAVADLLTGVWASRITSHFVGFAREQLVWSRARRDVLPHRARPDPKPRSA